MSHATLTPARIRDASPADAAAIERVARASWADTYADIFDASYVSSFLSTAYDPVALARAAERAASDDERHFLVAERDGEVVAFAHFGPGPRGPELYRIYADPAHYGTGAGAALLDELHRRIAGRVDRYVLDVHSRNTRGRAFYDRRGFVIVGGGATPECDLTLERRLSPPRVELPIRTDRLALRALRDDAADIDRLHAIYGDAETMRFVGATDGRSRISRRRIGCSVACATLPGSTGSRCGHLTSWTETRSSGSRGWPGWRAMARRWRPPTCCAEIAGVEGMPPRRCAPSWPPATTRPACSGSLHWRIRRTSRRSASWRRPG